MCIKNVNITSLICKRTSGDTSVSLEGVTNNLYGREEKDGTCVVDEFNIILTFSIIRPTESEEFNINYECSIRITAPKGKTAEIAHFSLENMIKIHREAENICRDFGTCTVLIPMKDFQFLDGVGNYILKIYIRDSSCDEKKFEIQSMDDFTVNLNNN